VSDGVFKKRVVSGPNKFVLSLVPRSLAYITLPSAAARTPAAVDRRDRQTDGRTDRYVNPARILRRQRQ